MQIDKNIPFFSNTPDDTHCFQACLKMILKYFYPEEEYSWEELDRVTAKKEGMWTWSMAGLMWLQDKGLEVKNIEVFDYEKFAKLGGQYLVEDFGEEVGGEQIKHCDIEQEKNIAQEFIKKIKTEKVVPEIKDLKELLLQDHIIICSVNSRCLSEETGYTGHLVVIKGFSDQGLILHDPGLPPLPNRLVDFDLFEKSWAYPSDKAKNIMAFKIK